MKTRRVGIVIDRDPYWREIFAQALGRANFDYYVLSEIFVDDEEATVFIIALLGPSGQVIGPEYVSRFRLSHPDALIVAVSADLMYTQRGAAMTVKEQFEEAGADVVLDKARYSPAAFTQLLLQK